MSRLLLVLLSLMLSLKRKVRKDILAVGLPHCCMRLATFYGPEMRAALALGVFLEKAHKNETIQIHGTGKQTRTMTFVDDIVSGIVTIAETEPKYTVVNITTEEIVSVFDMVNHAKKITGNNVECVHVEDRFGQIHEEMIYRVDYSHWDGSGRQVLKKE